VLLVDARLPSERSRALPETRLRAISPVVSPRSA
jgi:hypothetical protein